ncbi:hypothetical protein [Methylomonas sp. MgM2]
MKLFAIGDSLTQGFMSGAAAQANQSYVKLIANAIQASPFDVCDYWPRGGMPLNLEELLRTLEKRFGDNILGPIEWPLASNVISNFLDSSEDYWERGQGELTAPYPFPQPYFHNSAVWGMRIADAWNLNAALARDLVEIDKDAQGDGWFAIPGAPFYRTVNRLLNPRQTPDCDRLSALDWLEKHVTGSQPSDNQAGVENLIVWLGNNNVLGTALSLKPHQTTPIEWAGKTCLPHELPHYAREFLDNNEPRNWNLWRPDHFDAEYRELIRRIDLIMSRNPEHTNWNVFVANVPHVTIIPLIKGLGEQYVIKRPNRQGQPVDRIYFKYYAYFFLTEENLHSGWDYLTLQDALFIDDSIDRYNQSIDRILKEYNDQHETKRYHLIDTNDALANLAWKRNNGMPTYSLPEPLKFRYPPVNTKYYNAAFNGDKNVLKDGGIFSLDGVHPTAIGHGIIASEFLKVMRQANVTDSRGELADDHSLPWEDIIRSDTLYQKPIALVKELYQHRELFDLFKRIGNIF